MSEAPEEGTSGASKRRLGGGGNWAPKPGFFSRTFGNDPAADSREPNWSVAVAVLTPVVHREARAAALLSAHSVFSVFT